MGSQRVGHDGVSKSWTWWATFLSIPLTHLISMQLRGMAPCTLIAFYLCFSATELAPELGKFIQSDKGMAWKCLKLPFPPAVFNQCVLGAGRQCPSLPHSGRQVRVSVTVMASLWPQWLQLNNVSFKDFSSFSYYSCALIPASQIIFMHLSPSLFYALSEGGKSKTR